MLDDKSINPGLLFRECSGLKRKVGELDFGSIVTSTAVPVLNLAEAVIVQYGVDSDSLAVTAIEIQQLTSTKKLLEGLVKKGYLGAKQDTAWIDAIEKITSIVLQYTEAQKIRLFPLGEMLHNIAANRDQLKQMPKVKFEVVGEHGESKPDKLKIFGAAFETVAAAWVAPDSAKLLISQKSGAAQKADQATKQSQAGRLLKHNVGQTVFGGGVSKPAADGSKAVASAVDQPADGPR